LPGAVNDLALPFKRAAHFLDKVPGRHASNGTHPGPPTAKALGLGVPQSLLARAGRGDRVKPKQPAGPAMTLGNMRELAAIGRCSRGG
jgi:hypothetical protein